MGVQPTKYFRARFQESALQGEVSQVGCGEDRGRAEGGGGLRGSSGA